MYFIYSLVSLILGWSITFSQRPVSRPQSTPAPGLRSQRPEKASRRPRPDPDWIRERRRLESLTVQRCAESGPAQPHDNSLPELSSSPEQNQYSRPRPGFQTRPFPSSRPCVSVFCCRPESTFFPYPALSWTL